MELSETAAERPLALAQLCEGELLTAERLGLRGSRYELDVGFGRGASVRDWRSEDERSLLGIEIKAKCAARVRRWLRLKGRADTQVYQGDVNAALARRAPELRFDAIYLHFPDPWWKKRHAKRRVIRDDTLGAFVEALAPGGFLLLQTDVEERAQAFAALVEAQADPRLRLEALDHNPSASHSNREHRASEDGLPVYRWRLVRMAE